MMTLQVGVKAFLRNSEGKFLLVKRNAEKYGNTRGSWDIVGGRIDLGTSLLENLNREVKEETELEIVSDPRLLHAQDIFLSEKHVVRLTYSADVIGELKLDASELVEHQWLSLDEMQQQDDLDVYVKEILEKKILA